MTMHELLGHRQSNACVATEAAKSAGRHLAARLPVFPWRATLSKTGSDTLGTAWKEEFVFIQ